MSGYNETQPKNNDMKGIAFLSIGIMTIIAAIAGASFAYFQVTATNTTVVKGDSAYTDQPLTLTVTDATGYTKEKLIPQLGSAINVAANSTNKCKDGNNNNICHHYVVTIKNNSTANYYVIGTLQLVAASMPNFKWAVCTGLGNCPNGNGSTVSTTAFVNSTMINAGATQNYYFVVWIQETGSVQTDSGGYTGTITFNGYSSTGTSDVGITSTIKG